MCARWIRIAGYTAVVVAQLTLLGGAAVLNSLSKKKMMVMRYLFAKNRGLEILWFSPAGRTAQVAALVALSLALGALAWRWAETRFPATQAGLGAGLAALAAGMLAAVPPTAVIAVYAVVLALWVVLAVQLVVIAVSFLGRRAEA